MVRFFDFDERRLGNREDLPMFWVKKTGPGLPHYVRGRLVQGVGRSSNFSFRFDLNGGSVVYVFDPAAAKAAQQSDLPGPIAVVHGATYRVQVYVKTTALEHARARLTAYFVDRDGRQLERSVRHSDLFRGHGLSDDWHPLTVELHADDRAAAFLVLELGLLQPQLYAPQHLGPRTLFNQDVTGSAWFTDLSVSQVPDLTVDVLSPGGVFRRGEAPRLALRVSDRDVSDLFLRLEVSDAEGRLVHQRSGELPPAHGESVLLHEQVLELPELPAGWYAATVGLTARGQEVAFARRTFVQLPDEGSAVPPDPRLGITATEVGPQRWAELPAVLATLNAGRVKLAVWAEAWDVQGTAQVAFDQLLDRVLSLKVAPSAVFSALPPEIARAAGSARLARLGQLDPTVWKPRLMYLVSRHGNRMDGWQFGDDDAAETVADPAYRAAFDAVRSSVAELTAPPNLTLPWSATREPESATPSVTLALRVPPQVMPDQLGLLVTDAQRAAPSAMSRPVTLIVVPRDGQTPRAVRLRDLFERLVYAAASPAARIDVRLPYDGQDPDELLLVLRTVYGMLSNTVYRGPLRLHDGVEAHLFQQGARGVLALWPRRSGDAAPEQLTLDLGGRPVRVDAWGNRTLLRPAVRPAIGAAPPSSGAAATPGVAGASGLAGASGTAASSGAGTVSPAGLSSVASDRSPFSAAAVQLPLEQMPVFVDGIDPFVALFRMSVAVDNPYLQSQFQPHVRKLTFTNPFPDFLSGTVRLKPPAGWTVTPNTLSFNLNPGETWSREVQLELPMNTLAGVHPLAVSFELVGITPATVVVPVDLQVGLEQVALQTTVVREGAELVVQVTVTNRGDTPISFNAFAIVPGQQRQERLIAGLGPGRSVVRRFRFPALPEAEPGAGAIRVVRVGLRELDGNRLLNDEVPLP